MKSIFEGKTIYSRKDGTFAVDGYHVCPKNIDPAGKYDIEELKAYLLDHPDAIQPEPLPPPPTPEQLREAEIASLKAYLAGTDWYVARFAETGTAIPDEIKAARAAARVRIDELRGQV